MFDVLAGFCGETHILASLQVLPASFKRGAE